MVRSFGAPCTLSFARTLAWILPLCFLLPAFQLVCGQDVTSFAPLVARKGDSAARQHTRATSAKLVLHDASFIPDTILRVTSQTVTQSCMTKQDVAVVNGSIPGPEIRFVEGRVYWIRVYNDMADKNLTMHWHGLSMAVSPFSDGTPAASQWPIPPHHFFDYELETKVGMAGTYFYHSHVGFQAVTASGPLIVEDASPGPYKYDEDRVIALSDIFNKTDTQIETGLQASPFVWSGETLNVLVNGKGQLIGNATSPTCELATIDVEPDTTYRFRFIGGTALSFVSLAFEDHPELTIIEADGAYTKPVNTSHLQIGTGQRFSVLFRTKPQTALNKTQFYMQMETRDRPTLTRSYAVLNYKGASNTSLASPLKPALTLPNTTLGWLDYQLESVSPDSDFPSAAEVTRRVTVRVHQLITNKTTWAQNGASWLDTFPAEPYLVSLYKNDGIEFPSFSRAIANNGLDPVTRAFPANIGEVLEIVFQNTGSDNGGLDAHPFHAHGSHYYDIGSGNGTYDAQANEERLEGIEPAKRDTTILYRYGTTTTPGADAGWRAWRLRVTQPGVWMVHCHILQHMIMGMQTAWVMGNASEILTVPDDVIAGYLTYGGNVYGNETYPPSVMHFKSG